jgi:hypothetical protein
MNGLDWQLHENANHPIVLIRAGGPGCRQVSVCVGVDGWNGGREGGCTKLQRS